MESTKHARDDQRQRRLKRRLLQHLKENGATNYHVLYVQFDPYKKARIAPVLQDLRLRRYIELDQKDMTRITTAGLHLLEELVADDAAQAQIGQYVLSGKEVKV